MAIDSLGNVCVGGIEAGGTKFVCAVGGAPNELISVVEIPTTDPATTIRQAVEFFRSHGKPDELLSRLGIGSFGPLDLDANSPDFGSITATPKQGWEHVNLFKEFKSALDIPVVIDTDVNAAAIGEWTWGAARGLNNFLYVTVGTGIGVGAMIDGIVLRGVNHPEMGHMYLPVSEFEPDTFAGICPFHQSCAEGLACGPAIVARWGTRLAELPTDHVAWELEADYLATFFSNLTLVLQPEKIVVGGGVIQPKLLKIIRRILLRKLAGYRKSLSTEDAVAGYIVEPALKNHAGVLGAIALARGDCRSASDY